MLTMKLHILILIFLTGVSAQWLSRPNPNSRMRVMRRPPPPRHRGPHPHPPPHPPQFLSPYLTPPFANATSTIANATSMPSTQAPTQNATSPSDPSQSKTSPSEPPPDYNSFFSERMIELLKKLGENPEENSTTPATTATESSTQPTTPTTTTGTTESSVSYQEPVHPSLYQHGPAPRRSNRPQDRIPPPRPTLWNNIQTMFSRKRPPLPPTPVRIQAPNAVKSLLKPIPSPTSSPIRRFDETAEEETTKAGRAEPVENSTLPEVRSPLFGNSRSLLDEETPEESRIEERFAPPTKENTLSVLAKLSPKKPIVLFMRQEGIMETQWPGVDPGQVVKKYAGSTKIQFFNGTVPGDVPPVFLAPEDTIPPRGYGKMPIPKVDRSSELPTPKPTYLPIEDQIKLLMKQREQLRLIQQRKTADIAASESRLSSSYNVNSHTDSYKVLQVDGGKHSPDFYDQIRKSLPKGAILESVVPYDPQNSLVNKNPVSTTPGHIGNTNAFKRPTELPSTVHSPPPRPQAPLRPQALPRPDTPVIIRPQQPLRPDPTQNVRHQQPPRPEPPLSTRHPHPPRPQPPTKPAPWVGIDKPGPSLASQGIEIELPPGSNDGLISNDELQKIVGTLIGGEATVATKEISEVPPTGYKPNQNGPLKEIHPPQFGGPGKLYGGKGGPERGPPPKGGFHAPGPEEEDKFKFNLDFFLGGKGKRPVTSTIQKMLSAKKQFFSKGIFGSSGQQDSKQATSGHPGSHHGPPSSRPGPPYGQSGQSSVHEGSHYASQNGQHPQGPPGQQQGHPQGPPGQQQGHHPHPQGPPGQQQGHQENSHGHQNQYPGQSNRQMGSQYGPPGGQAGPSNSLNTQPGPPYGPPGGHSKYPERENPSPYGPPGYHTDPSHPHASIMPAPKNTPQSQRNKNPTQDVGDDDHQNHYPSSPSPRDEEYEEPEEKSKPRKKYPEESSGKTSVNIFSYESENPRAPPNSIEKAKTVSTASKEYHRKPTKYSSKSKYTNPSNEYTSDEDRSYEKGDYSKKGTTIIINSNKSNGKKSKPTVIITGNDRELPNVGKLIESLSRSHDDAEENQYQSSSQSRHQAVVALPATPTPPIVVVQQPSPVPATMEFSFDQISQLFQQQPQQPQQIVIQQAPPQQQILIQPVQPQQQSYIIQSQQQPQQYIIQQGQPQQQYIIQQAPQQHPQQQQMFFQQAPQQQQYIIQQEQPQQQQYIIHQAEQPRQEYIIQHAEQPQQRPQQVVIHQQKHHHQPQNVVYHQTSSPAPPTKQSYAPAPIVVPNAPDGGTLPPVIFVPNPPTNGPGEKEPVYASVSPSPATEPPHYAYPPSATGPPAQPPQPSAVDIAIQKQHEAVVAKIRSEHAQAQAQNSFRPPDMVSIVGHHLSHNLHPMHHQSLSNAHTTPAPRQFVTTEHYVMTTDGMVQSTASPAYHSHDYTTPRPAHYPTPTAAPAHAHYQHSTPSPGHQYMYDSTAPPHYHHAAGPTAQVQYELVRESDPHPQGPPAAPQQVQYELAHAPSPAPQQLHYQHAPTQASQTMYYQHAHSPTPTPQPMHYQHAHTSTPQPLYFQAEHAPTATPQSLDYQPAHASTPAPPHPFQYHYMHGPTPTPQPANAPTATPYPLQHQHAYPPGAVQYTPPHGVLPQEPSQSIERVDNPQVHMSVQTFSTMRANPPGHNEDERVLQKVRTEEKIMWKEFPGGESESPRVLPIKVTTQEKSFLNPDGRVEIESTVLNEEIVQELLGSQPSEAMAFMKRSGELRDSPEASSHNGGRSSKEAYKTTSVGGSEGISHRSNPSAFADLLRAKAEMVKMEQELHPKRVSFGEQRDYKSMFG